MTLAVSTPHVRLKTRWYDDEDDDDDDDDNN